MGAAEQRRSSYPIVVEAYGKVHSPQAAILAGKQI